MCALCIIIIIYGFGLYRKKIEPTCMIPFLNVYAVFYYSAFALKVGDHLLVGCPQDIQQGKTLEDENPSVLRDWVADVWKTGNVLYRCLTMCYTVILIIFMGYAVILVEISNRTRTRMSDGRLADQWLLAALRPAEWVLNVPLRRY